MTPRGERSDEGSPAGAYHSAASRRSEEGAGSAKLEKIVSGGQTGADRAALDWAIARSLEHGGWCPRGRRAEDGPVPPRYRLVETPSRAYVQRTEWNVRDSDGTVILSLAATLTGGARWTAELARRYRRPWLHLSRETDGPGAARRLRRFARERGIRVLNVAGPRASTEPGVGRFVRAVLDRAFPTSVRRSAEIAARAIIKTGDDGRRDVPGGGSR